MNNNALIPKISNFQSNLVRHSIFLISIVCISSYDELPEEVSF